MQKALSFLRHSKDITKDNNKRQTRRLLLKVFLKQKQAKRKDQNMTNEFTQHSVKPEENQESTEEPSSKRSKQRQAAKPKRNWKRRVKMLIMLAITIAIAFFATRPQVLAFASTLKTYLGGEVQTKAWNEAKRQNLEREIKNKSEELEKIKPMSFWIPTAQAAELETEKPVERPEINKRVEAWLIKKGSPLAEHTDVLMKQEHWKRILSIAFAESTLCKRYPKASANCWGIGGENLWDLGDGLDDGIVAVNNFLENYPNRAKKKYAEMTIEEMNGLYKQPYGAHWSVNNYTVLLELAEIEKQTK